MTTDKIKVAVRVRPMNRRAISNHGRPDLFVYIYFFFFFYVREDLSEENARRECQVAHLS
ncbi:hypothetical protein IscW_ISCW023556 [Ixodes scapularis]|uniref:Uncharacterized protein n=1 Tax=Ixodes scapularis TaxID=6945 RepID=B7QHX7_IXOSC|nr:hypothetical protein IscW_ISCW023556 [Ixodes scapularis]|eukprot:XP_002414784.1 hypothetical protein IscW_ISCW023556 [Ixodes scapularis]